MAISNSLSKIAKSTTITLIGVGLSAAFVTLPASAQLASAQSPATNPVTGDLVPLNTTTPIHPNFAFTNVLEYSDCLAAILDAYLRTDSSLLTRQNSCQSSIQQATDHNGLSRSEALELISAADFYSSHFLERTLYPPKGLRIRIAENFGFIYQIDQNDPDMLNRAAQ